MTEPVDLARPCAAGCITTDANVAVAVPGSLYCSRCWALADSALKACPPLVAHLLRQVGGLRSKPGHDGSQRTKGASAPLPFNARAFDGANDVYRTLVGWAMRVRRPGLTPWPMTGAWRQQDGQVVGLPFDVPTEAARREVQRLVDHLLGALPLIFASSNADEVAALQHDLARLHRLDLKHPREDRPAFSTRAACPDDAGRLLIVPPRDAQADRTILCSVCGRHFTEEEHERVSGYLKAIARQAGGRVRMSAATAAELIRRHPLDDEEAAA